MPDARSDRVLVLAPVGRDATASAELLRKAGVAAEVCGSLKALVEALTAGAAALFLAEEALFGRDLELLQSRVRGQPAWSDLPVVVLTSHHQDPRVASWRQELVARLGNVSLLERPVHPITLTSTLQAAVRARRRQYEVKSLLEMRDRSAQELQCKVSEATQELRQQMEHQARLEETLRQAQKMEAIGQLTGGVAHDFNNLLMVITAGLDMLERDHAREAKGREAKKGERFGVLIKGMRNAAQRGSDLTRQLLTFARRKALKPEPINMARQLGGMRELLDRSLRGNLRLVMDFGPNLWPIEVDPGEFELVVLNLAFNARDAMPNGGTITVRAENAQDWRGPPHGANGQDDTPVGDFVRLSVNDTGTGMTAEVKARAFEPFFTTKEVGKGSGLGLAQAYGFARASGGTVWIQSELGRGTSIVMMLPRSHAEIPDQPARLDTPPNDDDGERSRHILLVEDDEEVARLVSEMLIQLGHQVMRAGSALGALAALANGRPIDLVFSDIMMAGDMDGLGLARELKLRRPELPVLLTSGYSEMARKAIEAGNFQMLAKPYRLNELKAAILRACRGRFGASFTSEK
jgi:signal transduction histidine kinase/ActR/RegA family two-component response regulator